MAANFSTVKLARDLVDEARREAELLHRSLSGQIEHWATLGRAVENARTVSVLHVRQALAGEPPLEALDALDQEAAFGRLGGQFASPAAAVRNAYVALGQMPGAIGDADQEVLSRRGAMGAVEPA